MIRFRSSTNDWTRRGFCANSAGVWFVNALTKPRIRFVRRYCDTASDSAGRAILLRSDSRLVMSFVAKASETTLAVTFALRLLIIGGDSMNCLKVLTYSESGACSAASAVDRDAARVKPANINPKFFAQAFKLPPAF